MKANEKKIKDLTWQKNWSGFVTFSCTHCDCSGAHY